MRNMTARKQARESGERYYETGNPCKQGHISKRATLTGTCVLCTQQAAADWAKRHPEKFRVYAKKYRAENIEVVREKDRLIAAEFRAANPEIIKERKDRAYREKILVEEGREVGKLWEDSWDEFVRGYKGKYDFSVSIYTAMTEPVAYICPDHGVKKQEARQVMRGRVCNECSHVQKGLSRRLSQEEFLERAKLHHGNTYDYSEAVYEGLSKKVIIGCATHGRFNQVAEFHMNGASCPKCYRNISKTEQAMADFLAQYTVVEQSRRDLISPQEIDIYLPEFKLGIEYHGLYWHSVPRVMSLYHREKYEAANKAGIRLVQIFEDEWLDKTDIIKNRLLAFIGKAPQYQARKLSISQVPMSEVRSFLIATHIQGAGVASYCYALKEGETIVAVATFGKARSGAMTGAKIEGRWEVTRYASTGRVQGGFSRLLKQFKTDKDPNEIISYCDLRYGDGRLYEATGFTLASVTEPDYWWVPKGEVKRIPRYSVQKHKLSDPKHPLNKFYAPIKTENEICTEAGWSKIHGVGSQKWVWKKEST